MPCCASGCAGCRIRSRAADRQAGYRYDISILQAEFSLTQVLDRPRDRPHLLRGSDPREPRPRPTRSGATDLRSARAPAARRDRFRTRVADRGRDPVACTSTTRARGSSSTTRKAAPCAPRPPSTTPATSASASGCRICPPCGRSASKPTDVCWTSNISHDCTIGEDAFDQVVRPIEVDGQRATALRFGDARAQALLTALVVFSVQTQGFTHAEMRTFLANCSASIPAISRWRNDLRSAPPPTARPDPAYPQNQSLPDYRPRPEGRDVLQPHLHTTTASWIGRNHRTPRTLPLAATRRVRSSSQRHQPALRRPQTGGMKLDSFTPRPMNQGL